VLKAGVDRPSHEIVAELVARVRQILGPVAAFKNALVVPRLPKTRSGKILRKTMRGIADGNENEAVPSTIDDVATLDALRPTLRMR
jgi:propionyl-CoA synthetase